MPPGPYRSRTTKIGDILDSNPTVQFRTGFGYQNLPTSVNGSATGSATYATSSPTSRPMRRSTLGRTTACCTLSTARTAPPAARSCSPIVPNSVLPNSNRLVQPSYHTRISLTERPPSATSIDGGWRTLLIGATGAGGRSVFGLDVTSPADSRLRTCCGSSTTRIDTDMGTSDGRTLAADDLGRRHLDRRIRQRLQQRAQPRGTVHPRCDEPAAKWRRSTLASAALEPARIARTQMVRPIAQRIVERGRRRQRSRWRRRHDLRRRLSGQSLEVQLHAGYAATDPAHPAHLCTQPWHLGLGGLR